MIQFMFLETFFRAYSILIFVNIFQWTSSEFFFNFRFFSRVSKPVKTTEKGHSFYNTVSLKKLTHYMNLNSLDIENNMLLQHSQKPFWIY